MWWLDDEIRIFTFPLVSKNLQSFPTKLAYNNFIMQVCAGLQFCLSSALVGFYAIITAWPNQE